MTTIEPGDSPRSEWRRLLLRTIAALVAFGVLATGVVLAIYRASTDDDEPEVNIVSPLVDIRSMLTNRANVELLRINADSPAYWRVTTLPEYDGHTFRLPARPLEPIEGEIASIESGGTIRQQIQILALGGRLVPAAAEPVQAEGATAGGTIEVRLNRDTMTMVAPGDLEPGDLFTVVSAAARLDSDQLRSATSTTPPDAVFGELPDDVPPSITELAGAVIGSANNSYDKALALQDWFRSEFEYSLEVQPGYSPDAVAAFLDDRVGHAEQFSVAFAVMARTLGLPSRVAVGFTPGTLDDEGWYRVNGAHAHAWPEIWFDDIGWVPFEPTPGRGAPGAEAYTGVPADQGVTATN